MALISPVQFDPHTLDFDLPKELIAQEPCEKRDQARLMIITRSPFSIKHQRFSDLGDLLEPGDVLVLNHAKVSPAKLMGKKTSGGKVEVILIEPYSDSCHWKALVRPFLKEGTPLELEGGGRVKLVHQLPSGENVLHFLNKKPEDLMQGHGRIPLPPYIKREQKDPRHTTDRIDYQTVYAKKEGSLAAPTAGLHFTQELIEHCRNKGVKVLSLLLNVGWGTFKPISGYLKDHSMLPESYELSGEILSELKEAKAQGRRIISVGTTVTRVLESIPFDTAEGDKRGKTNLFIKPGFQFQWLSGLITNFHVPRSTPIALTAAFMGLSNLENAYTEAIKERYRFFSYGDAMMIL